MKIYVASKFDSQGRTREVMALLTEMGHKITYDWTQNPDTEDQATLMRIAGDDIRGVRSCDVLVIIAENEGAYKGTCSEMGAALALGKPVMVLGDGMKHNIFSHHVLVNVYDDLSSMCWMLENDAPEPKMWHGVCR